MTTNVGFRGYLVLSVTVTYNWGVLGLRALLEAQGVAAGPGI